MRSPASKKFSHSLQDRFVPRLVLNLPVYSFPITLNATSTCTLDEMNWTSSLCNFSTSCLKNNMHCKGHKSTSYQETSSCAKYCGMILTLQNTPVVNHSCPLLFQLLVHTTEKVSALIYMHWVFQHFSKPMETWGVRTMGSYSDPVKRENWLWRSFVCAGKIIGQRLLTCSFNQRYACIFLQVLLC